LFLKANAPRLNTARRIGQLTNRLYGLTEKEIAVVEEATQK